MIVDFVIGVLLLGSMLHLSFGLWNVKMISLFGSSGKSNILYGLFVLMVSLGLYLYQHGLNQLLNNYIILGGIFAIIYMVGLGLWIRVRK